VSAPIDTVIGVDPGPTPGVAVLTLQAGALAYADVFQCTHAILPTLVNALILPPDEFGPNERGPRYTVALEKFVIGRKSMRAGAAGHLTRAVIADLRGGLPDYVFVLERSAAAVKPWATDDRLDRAGLWTITKGMPHARDAARHALFCAVHDRRLPDPLTRKATS